VRRKTESYSLSYSWPRSSLLYHKTTEECVTKFHRAITQRKTHQSLECTKYPQLLINDSIKYPHVHYKAMVACSVVVRASGL